MSLSQGDPRGREKQEEIRYKNRQKLWGGVKVTPDLEFESMSCLTRAQKQGVID